MADDLTIERLSENEGKALILRLSGSLDVATTRQMKQSLAEVSSASYRDLLIDLTALEFLDSTGLGALIGAHRRAAEAGERLELIVSDGPIARLLNITGLSRVFTIFGSLGEALERIGAVE